ncbi:hypothetical protein THIX_20675 [Thiomonas sp. X19]|nr:hypothetical protein THIX_20675 [Thiomonas sp. X19]
MLDSVKTKFSHVRPGDTVFKGEGLRDFFHDRDPGIKEATNGRVVSHLVKATDIPPETGGTGWHFHAADFQIVIMTKDWARFMYEDQDTLVAAGDVVRINARASCIASTTTRPAWSIWKSSARPTSARSMPKALARFHHPRPGNSLRCRAP